MNRDYYAGMTEGRIQERETMSIDQKQMFEAGINNERDRVLRLLGELNYHGMTHGPHCEAWHGFYEQAVYLISPVERPSACDGCDGLCSCG